MNRLSVRDPRGTGSLRLGGLAALLLLRGWAAAQPDALPPVDVATLYEQTLNVYTNGYYGEAFQRFGQLVELDPDEEAYNFGHAMSALAVGKLGQAAQAFERVLAINPANERARLELAKTYLLAGQLELAEEYFRQVLERAPAEPVVDGVEWYLERIREMEADWTSPEAGDIWSRTGPVPQSDDPAAAALNRDLHQRLQRLLQGEDHARYIGFWKAIQRGDVKHLEEYVAGGGDVNARDAEGVGALHRAAEAGHRAVVEFLLDRGGRASMVDPTGLTPLHAAAARGEAAVAELLIERGAAVNQPTLDGWTPLHAAVEGGHVMAARILLEAGATPYALATVDDKPVTPWDAARVGNQPEMVNLLANYVVRPHSAGDARAASPSVIDIDVDRLRQLSIRGIRRRVRGVDLSNFHPGYVLFMDHPHLPNAAPVIVEWLGREPLAEEAGETPELDRRKVRKLRVTMSRRGTVRDVEDTVVWLYRPQWEAEETAARWATPQRESPLAPTTSARRHVDTFELIPRLSDVTMHRYALLERDDVQRELDLSEAQFEAVRRVFVTPASGIPELTAFLEERVRQRPASAPPDEAVRFDDETNQRIRDLTSQYHEQQLLDILTEEQVFRLQQLILQMRGPLLAAMWRDLADVLGLEPATRDAMLDLADDHAERIGRPLAEFGQELVQWQRGDQRAPVEAKLDRLIRTIRERVDERDTALLGLMSEDQRGAYFETLGPLLPIEWDPYEFTRVPFAEDVVAQTAPAMSGEAGPAGSGGGPR